MTSVLAAQLNHQFRFVRQLRHEADQAGLDEQEPILWTLVLAYAQALSKLNRNHVQGVERDDIASETALAVLSLKPHCTEVVDRAALSTYMYQLVHNVVHDLRDKQGKLQQLDEGANSLQGGPTEQEGIDKDDYLGHVRRFYRQLSLVDRTVIRQRMRRLSPIQAARELEMSRANYQRLAARRIEKMRRRLS